MLLAIDPGADAGWALFDANRILIACGLGDPRSSPKHRIDDVTQVIIEKPKIYPGIRQKARPADIILLAVRAGEWGGIYRRPGIEVGYVEPHSWKGELDKAIHHGRVWNKLSGLEQSIVLEAANGIAKSKRHNVLDAIGLGLWRLSR